MFLKSFFSFIILFFFTRLNLFEDTVLPILFLNVWNSLTFILSHVLFFLFCSWLLKSELIRKSSVYQCWFLWVLLPLLPHLLSYGKNCLLDNKTFQGFMPCNYAYFFPLNFVKSCFLKSRLFSCPVFLSLVVINFSVTVVTDNLLSERKIWIVISWFIHIITWPWRPVL